jgi:hypothetical protein
VSKIINTFHNNINGGFFIYWFSQGNFLTLMSVGQAEFRNLADFIGIRFQKLSHQTAMEFPHINASDQLEGHQTPQ